MRRSHALQLYSDHSSPLVNTRHAPPSLALEYPPDAISADRSQPTSLLGVVEHLFEHREERIHVTADKAINILGGAGCRIEPVLQRGAAFEEEQLASILVERTLDRADGDRVHENMLT